MTRQISALCWATSILLLALGVANGTVAAEYAQPLFTILPIMAWFAVCRPKSCRLSKGAE